MGGLNNGAIPSIVAGGTYPLVFLPVDIASFLNCLANSLMKGERFLVRFSTDLLRVRVRLRRRGLYRLLTGERLDRLFVGERLDRLLAGERLDRLLERSVLRLLRSRDRLLRLNQDNY